jgi:hypothetical protein
LRWIHTKIWRCVNELPWGRWWIVMVTVMMVMDYGGGVDNGW